jgi:putative tributyrin esterase
MVRTVKIRSAVVLFALGLFLLQTSLAQFNRGRRRSDLEPLSLPAGSAVEFKSFDSECLGTQAHYSIFLPPSYSGNAQKKYPVIYFLHGLNNDETSWTVERYGHIQEEIETLMVSGKIPEFIMVHPRGENGFYCNYLDGTRRYEDFVTEELTAYVEKNYRARKERENRSIAGTSMGGYGALKIAMKHPGRYSSVVGQSPILFPGSNPMEIPEEMKTDRFFSFFIRMLTPVFGDPVRQDVWDANNPLVLAKSRELDTLRIYFDYGTDDRYISMVHLDEGSKALDRSLTEAHITHTFRIHEGEPHGWALVAAHLEETLPFLCRTFTN